MIFDLADGTGEKSIIVGGGDYSTGAAAASSSSSSIHHRHQQRQQKVDDFLILIRFDGRIQCIDLQSGRDAWLINTDGGNLCHYQQKTALPMIEHGAAGEAPCSGETNAAAAQKETATSAAAAAAPSGVQPWAMASASSYGGGGSSSQSTGLVTPASPPVMLAGFSDTSAVHSFVLHDGKMMLADDHRAMNQESLVSNMASMLNSTDSSYLEVHLRTGKVLVKGVDDARRITPNRSDAPGSFEDGFNGGPVLAIVRHNKVHAGRVRHNSGNDRDHHAAGGVTTWKFQSGSIRVVDLDSPSLRGVPWSGPHYAATPLLIKDREDGGVRFDSQNNGSAEKKMVDEDGTPTHAQRRHHHREIDVFVDGRWRVQATGGTVAGATATAAPSWWAGCVEESEVVRAFHYCSFFSTDEKLRELPVKIFDDDDNSSSSKGATTTPPAAAAAAAPASGAKDDTTQMYINVANHFLFIVGEAPVSYPVHHLATQGILPQGPASSASAAMSPVSSNPSFAASQPPPPQVWRVRIPRKSLSSPTAIQLKLLEGLRSGGSSAEHHQRRHHHTRGTSPRVEQVSSVDSTSDSLSSKHSNAKKDVSPNIVVVEELLSETQSTAPSTASSTTRKNKGSVATIAAPPPPPQPLKTSISAATMFLQSLDESSSSSSDSCNDDNESRDDDDDDVGENDKRGKHRNKVTQRHTDPNASRNSTEEDAYSDTTSTTTTTTATEHRKGKSFFDVNFEAIRVLGQGVSGVVLLCRQKATGILYAIKIIIAESCLEEDEVLREVKLHAPLMCEHIVRYHSCWSETITRQRMLAIRKLLSEQDAQDSDIGMVGVDDEDEDEDDGTATSCSQGTSVSSVTRNIGKKAMFIQMEYCHTTLAVRLSARRCVDRVENLVAAIQLINGVMYLHHRGIVHRDLKPTNVMMLLQCCMDREDPPDHAILSADLHSLQRHQQKNHMNNAGGGGKKRSGSLSFHRKQRSLDSFTTSDPSSSSDEDDEEGEREEVYQPPFFVKLGDLGIAKFEGQPERDPSGYFAPVELHTTGVGSPIYSSPEQLSGKSCQQESDIFSLGVVMSEMYLKPTTISERLDVLLKVRDRIFSESWLAAFPELHVARAMLHPNPEKRLSLLKAKKRLRKTLSTLVLLPPTTSAM